MSKRMFDIICSILSLLLLFPFLIVVGLLIRVSSKGPAIFKQQRIGLNNKYFTIYKFRTMDINAPNVASDKVNPDEYSTGIGKVLRDTSIDELPQLWNILIGDMSFVGPRPPLTYHPWPINEYTSEQKRMFEVRPGITGWAQVHGRKEVEWHKRIKMNVWYVDHISFLLDLKIIFMTVFKVLSNADNENVKETVSK